MTGARLIESPYHLGREDVGLGAGVAPLAAAIGGERVRARLRRSEANEVAASLAAADAIADAVRRAVADGAFPFVLAGNCNSSLGTVTGLGGGVGVVWLDSHADFQTPETTRSGFFDGFALSMLTGTGWDELRRAHEFVAVPEEHVVLCARAIEEGERRRLRRSRVHLTDVGGMAAALDDLATRVSEVYLHVDLDVLDPGEARANEWAAPNGPSAEQIEQMLRDVARRFSIRAAALTAYDPSVDPEQRLPAIAARLARRIIPAAALGAVA